MPMEELGDGLFCIDLMEEGQPFRSSSYILVDEQTIIVETGASPCVPSILSALAELRIPLEQISAVVVTHIHLDHSGGAGRLMEMLPSAQLYVHPKGAQHLIHPERLIQSAKIVYGESFYPLFDPIIPVPKDKVLPIEDACQMIISPRRTLRFFHSPGHALHHLIVFDSQSGGIFSGDAAGVMYRPIREKYGVEMALANTTPTQFDPIAMENTLNHMLELQPKALFYTHFGASFQPKERLEEVKHWIPCFSQKGVQIYQKTRSWQSVADFLTKSVYQFLYDRGIPENDPVLQCLDLDIELSAKGVESYVQRMEKQ